MHYRYRGAMYNREGVALGLGGGDPRLIGNCIETHVTGSAERTALSSRALPARSAP